MCHVRSVPGAHVPFVPGVHDDERDWRDAEQPNQAEGENTCNM